MQLVSQLVDCKTLQCSNVLGIAFGCEGRTVPAARAEIIRGCGRLVGCADRQRTGIAVVAESIAAII
jgi:hypothetical protein